jgi:hypothetical protein
MKFRKNLIDPSTQLLLSKTRRKTRRRTTFTTLVLGTFAAWIAGEVMEKKGVVKIKTKHYESPAVD